MGAEYPPGMTPLDNTSFPSDITASNHGGNAFSAAANTRAEHKKPAHRKAILAFLTQHPDEAFCAEQVYKALGLGHENSGRWTELQQDGYIEAVGTTLTSKGSMAETFRIVTDPARVAQADVARKNRLAKMKEAKTAKLTIAMCEDLGDGDMVIRFSAPRRVSYTYEGMDVELEATSFIGIGAGMTNIVIDADPLPKNKRR